MGSNTQPRTNVACARRRLCAALLTTATLLLGCGGGAGGGTSASAPAPSAPAQPAPATVLNPLTGMAAPGTPTSVIRGTALPGSSVTVHRVLSDGSSAAALAPAVTANINGEFAIQLDAPAGNWLRIVARGGRYTRTVDLSVHPVDSMELVTPFVTSEFNYLVLSPVTEVAARIMAQHASKGAALPDAFKLAMRTVLQLDLANWRMLDDTSVYLSMLKNSVASDQGWSAADTVNHTYLQVGIDRFGVLLDLPSAEVWRVLAAAGEQGFKPGAIDAGGRPVTAGTWLNGQYLDNQRISLQDLMNAKVMDEMKETDAGTGARVAPSIRDLVGRYLILEFFVDHACVAPQYSLLAKRYPFYLNGTSTPDAATCTTARRRVGYFNDLLNSNNTMRWK